MTAPSCHELIAIGKAHHPHADWEPVRRAFDVARRWHEGQTRRDGKPYIFHPLAVATIVAEHGFGPTVVGAAVLHDVLEDTPYPAALMRAEFGAEVTGLVQRLDDPQLWHAPCSGEMAQEDLETLVVRLADRLHNMRTLRYVRPAMQIRKSRETLQLVAPIAHRLGMIEVKHELEELSLRVLRPPASPSAPFALRLLAFTALVLPRHEQARWREEWHAELSVMPARLQRARFAWQTAVGVPRLAWALRGSRPEDTPLWTVSLARIARTLGLTGAVVAFTAPGPAVAWAAGLVALAALGLLGVVLFGRSEVPMARLARLIRAWRGNPPT